MNDLESCGIPTQQAMDTKSEKVSTSLESTKDTESSNSEINPPVQLPKPTSKKLTFRDTVVVLSAWATSGCVIIIPWSFGQLGYILGPIILSGIVLMTLFFLNFLLSVAEQCDDGSCNTLGDVGYLLAGKKGKFLFEGLQMANLILYMPVALETVGFAFEYLFDGDCLGWWNIISFGVLYVFLQLVQTWNHISWIAYLTLAITAAKAFVLLPYAFLRYKDDVISSEQYLGPAQAIGNPNATWYDLSMAVSTLSAAFTPVYVLFEVRSTMENPRQSKQALAIASILQVAMYLTTGLVCIAVWGWNVADPITLEIPRDWLGLLLNSVILLAVALDYTISAKLVNSWLSNVAFRTWQNLDSSPMARLFHTLPTAIFSLLMVLAIPNFETLIGIVVSLSVIGINSWGITLAWHLGRQQYPTNVCLMWAGFVVGALYTCWAVSGALYEIVTADYAVGFFCSGD